VGDLGQARDDAWDFRGERRQPREPDNCASGQSVSFFGIDAFRDDARREHVRVFDDHVEMPIGPERSPVGIDRSQCRTFDVVLHQSTNKVVGYVLLMDGYVRLDCSVDGRNVTANFEFDGCH
jgi:hypothetical protein